MKRFLLSFILLFKIIFSQAANQTCTSGGDQMTYGSGSWIGYVYGTNATSNQPTGSTNSFTPADYVGYVTEATNYTELWGGTDASAPTGGCPSCVTFANNDAINFSIRYKNALSEPAGWYYITIGSDDGSRLYLSSSANNSTGAASTNPFGTTYVVNDNWGGTQGYTKASNTVYWPGGTMYLTMEYYQGTGGAEVSFNICQVGTATDVYPTFPSWNGYVYSDAGSVLSTPPADPAGVLTPVAGNYSSEFSPPNSPAVGTYGSTVALISENWNSGAPGSLVTLNPVNNTTCATSWSSAPTSDWAIRYKTNRTFASTGYYYYTTPNNDDGSEVIINGNAVFNNFGSGANGSPGYNGTSYVAAGTYNMQFLYQQDGGGSQTDLSECLMGGDETFGRFPVWHATVFNASSNYADNNYVAGFNTTMNSYSTGTASQSGTTVTGVGTNFTAAMVGATITYANAATATITGYTSATTLTVSPSQTEASQSYTVNTGLSYSTGTASQSGTTITGAGTTFTATMVGSTIEYANGVTAYITAYTNGTTLTAAVSQTVTSQAYSISTQVSNNFASAAPTSLAGLTLAGNTCGKTQAGTGSYSIRYRTDEYFPNGLYVFSTPGNDDGGGLTINTGGYDQNTNLGTYLTNLSCITCGAQTQTSVPQLLNGSCSLIYDFYGNGAPNKSSLETCQMTVPSNDYTLNTSGSGVWNVYAYNNYGVGTTGNIANGGSYTYSLSNYVGHFTSGSANTNSAYLNTSSAGLTDGNVGTLATGTCSLPTAVGSTNQYIKALCTTTFNPGAYTMFLGQDDNYFISFDGGVTFPYSGTGGGGFTKTVYLSGLTNMVYEGNNSGGSGAIYNVTLAIQNPTTGTLTASQTCGSGSTTLYLTGNVGYVQWQSSPDGSTWANLGSPVGQTNPSLVVTPGSNTYYRAVVTSNASSLNSNTVYVGTSFGDQTSYGTNGQWIGYLYNNATGSTNSFTPADYVGWVTEGNPGNPDFLEAWGGTDASPPLSYPTLGCATAGTNYSIRYKTSITEPAGFYYVTVGSDDGSRLYISQSANSATGTAGSNPFGTTYLINDGWGNTQGYTTASSTVYWPGGTMYLVYEYYQGTGGAEVSFNMCQVGTATDGYGTFPTWNAYAYDNTSALSSASSDPDPGGNLTYPAGNYTGYFTNSSPSGTYTVGTNYTLINDNWAGGSPRTLLTLNPGTNSCNAVWNAPTTDWSVRYKTTRTYANTGYYYYTTPGIDDGGELDINGTAIFADFSGGSPGGSGWTGTTYQAAGTALPFEFQYQQQGGGSAMNLTECLMTGNQNFGTFPTWNTTFFNTNNSWADNNYAGYQTYTFSGTPAIQISENWGSTTPALSGSTCGKTLPQTDFSARFRTNESFSNGLYVFSGINAGVYNDDGAGLTINSGFNNNTTGTYISGLNCTSCSAGTQVSSPQLLNGNYSLIYDYVQLTGGANAELGECQMTLPANDLTLSTYGSGSWNVYLYNAPGASGSSYPTFGASDYSNYVGYLTTGSSSTIGTSFTLTSSGNTNPPSSYYTVNGNCSRVASSTYFAIQGFLTNSFLMGIYTITSAADDFSQVSINGGSSWIVTQNTTCCTSASTQVALNGSYNLVYEGINQTAGWYFTPSITLVSPVAGTLSSNLSCAGAGTATFSVTGGTGWYQLQSSVDGVNSWTPVGSYQTSSTLSDNPASTTFYRVAVTSGATTLYTNVVAVVRTTNSSSLTIATNVTMGGTFSVTGDFTVNSGATITVPQGCALHVTANNITINGSINADAAGNLGAGGGGAGYSCDCSSGCSAGACQNLAIPGGSGGGGSVGNGTGAGGAGNNGQTGSKVSRSCNTTTVLGIGYCSSNNDGNNDGGPGGGGGGGGAYGGAGGGGKSGGNGWNRSGQSPAPIGGAGGSAGSAYGSSDLSSETISMGSGGGGGGGGGGGSYCGSSGSSGGNGGGSVWLNASQNLTIGSSSIISANGAVGSAGGAGSSQQGGYNKCTINVGATTCATTYDGSGGGGAGAGGGSGGGILLESFGPANIAGIIRANGGAGGAGGAQGDGSSGGGMGGAGGGGGRIKIATNPCQTNSISATLTTTAGSAGSGANGNSNGIAGNNGTINTTINNPGYAALSAATVTGTQSICSAVNLGVISEPASTGGTGTYSYQWYQTTISCGATFTQGSQTAPIGWSTFGSVGTSPNLDPPSLTQTTCYALLTVSGSCSVWSNVVTITVIQLPMVTTPNAASICNSIGPDISLTASAASSFAWTIGTNAGSITGASSGSGSVINQILTNPSLSNPGTIVYNVTPTSTTGSCVGSVYPITVTVIPDITPTVSIDPTPNYIVCNDDQIHFTATASGTGGSTPTYQWEINGNPVGGQTNPTYTDNAPADGAIVTCVLTSTYACPTPGSNPATSNPTTMVVGVCNNTWNGSVAGDNTNWDNPGNWNANHVPSNCADGANFPPGLAHYPILTQPESVGDVILQQPGGTVNLGSYNLSVCGNITVETATQAPASVSIPSTGGLIVLDGIAGSSTQTISGALTAYEVKVNTQATGGAMLTNTGSITVNNALDLQLGNLNATTAGSSITFTSSSVTQVAILDNFSPGFTGTITTNNNVKSQRYYAVSTYFYTHQHMMGSPVSGASTTLAQMGAGSTSGYVIPQADCDEYAMGAGTPYGNVFKLDQSHGATCGMAQWYVEPGGTAVTNGQGYSVVLPGSGTLTLTGSANTSPDYTLTSLANNNWINATAEHHTLSSGWQLVSNPYQATLALNTANSGMDGQVQVWQANGPFEGTYVAGLVGSVNIAPFQAYMVHVSTPGNMNGSYTINGADRVRTPATFLNQNANELDITAQNMGNNLLDKAVVAFNTSATDSFDTQFDADKFAGSEGRHLVYTALNDGKWMAINTLHDVATTSTVPMGFEPGSSGNYSFAFDKVNTFDPTTYIFLEDKQQQVMYNVRNGNYLFSSDAADGWNRFVLHFTPPAVIASTDAGCNSLGVINITQPGTANWDYTLTDAGNTVIASGVLNQNNPLNLSAPAGTYTLTLVDNNNYTVTKVIQLNGAQPVTAAFAPSANNVNTQAAVNFTNTSTGANTYSWNFGDGSTSALVSPVHTYTAPGIYTVELTATNASGCSAISNQTITVSNTATGINAVTENGISLWSNTNKVYVDFTHAGTDVNAVIKIYDVLGQELSEDKYTLNGLYQKEIDNIEAAYIIVAVNNNDKITTKKLFINNIAK